MSELFKNAPIVKVVMLRGEDGTATKLSELRNDMTFLTEQQIITLVTNIVDTGEVGDIDTGFVTKLVEQNKKKALQFWVGTQAEYNAISEKTANMFYIITDDPFKADVNAAIAALNARIDAIEIPDIEAELSQLQTDMQNLEESTEQTIQQFEADVAGIIDEKIAEVEASHPVYEVGDTDTYTVQTAGYIYYDRNKVYFVIPLRRYLGADKDINVTTASFAIRYFGTQGKTDTIAYPDATDRIVFVKNGLFLAATYTHNTALWVRENPPAVGVSITLSFTVTAVNE
jgi:hypothetical protein